MAAVREIAEAPPVGPGVARADRFVVYALALFRGLQLVVGLAVIVLRADQYTHLTPVVVAYEPQCRGVCGCSVPRDGAAG